MVKIRRVTGIGLHHFNLNIDMKYLLILMTVWFTACGSIDDGYRSLSRTKNNCVPDAISYQDAYNNNQRFQSFRWSRVLIIKFPDRAMGHAVCVFEYKNRIMIKDNVFGSYTVKASPPYSKSDLENLKQSPIELATLWDKNRVIRDAWFLSNE